ncbi:unnamed protein product, partial [Nesidiocoris tenuis]
MASPRNGRYPVADRWSGLHEPMSSLRLRDAHLAPPSPTPGSRGPWTLDLQDDAPATRGCPGSHSCHKKRNLPHCSPEFLKSFFNEKYE